MLPSSRHFLTFAHGVRRFRRVQAQTCDVVLAVGLFAPQSLRHLTSGSRSATGACSWGSCGLAAPRLFRLHGSPRKYWSRHDESYIATLAETVRSIPSADEVWCVFDNTASGAAIENAWQLHERVFVTPSLGSERQ
jgi:Protein of unknown function DUF72